MCMPRLRVYGLSLALVGSTFFIRATIASSVTNRRTFSIPPCVCVCVCFCSIPIAFRCSCTRLERTGIVFWRQNGHDSTRGAFEFPADEFIVEFIGSRCAHQTKGHFFVIKVNKKNWKVFKVKKNWFTEKFRMSWFVKAYRIVSSSVFFLLCILLMSFFYLWNSSHDILSLPRNFQED